MLAEKIDRGSRIFDGFGFIQTLIELYRLLKIGIAVGQLYAALLPPEQIGTDRHKSMRCVPVSDAAQEFIDPKNLLQDNDPWAEARGRQRDVGVEFSTVK